MSPLIREGDRSRQVADVQARLRALGYSIDDDAGFFGPATRAAVRAFQQKRNVLVDGIVGNHTWSELVEASWRLGDRALYLQRPPMRGDDVLALQTRLNALGFDGGREDGIFGADTDTAVRSFQREYGLVEDGIFGSKGFAALEGLRVERPATAAPLREQLRHAQRGDVRGALVVIDPGHGNEDTGGVGPEGVREEDVCWDVARRLAERLRLRGARVRLSRTQAETPDATERARRANELGADLFVSLHLNWHDEPTAEGACCYFFGTSGVGRSLAEAIQRNLVSLGLKDCRTHPRSYPVLKETRMPAVLVEPAFISNPEDERRLREATFRQHIADAITDAITAHFQGVATQPPTSGQNPGS